MKKKPVTKKLELKKKTISKLNSASVLGGQHKLANAAPTDQLTGCGMTCWSYGNYCFLSENCA